MARQHPQPETRPEGPPREGVPAPMYYAELPARPELAPWIAAHWLFRVVPDAGEIEHTIPLTGGVLLSVAPGRHATLVGPRTEPLRTTVRGGDLFFGSHLWPGAAPSLLALQPEELEELVGGGRPAEAVLGEAWVARLLAGPLVQGDGIGDGTGPEEGAESGKDGSGDRGPDKDEQEDDGPEDRDERRAVAAHSSGDLPALEAAVAARLDEAWEERAAVALPLDEAVMGAVFRLLASGGGTTLPDLAAIAGLSERHFRRRFRAVVGLSPKELARVQRLRASAVALVQRETPHWVALAADHGYADQAHLVREYRRLLGTNPTRFRHHVGRIHHSRLLR